MQLEHWISHSASRTPDKVAICFQGEQMTYSQFDELIGRLAWVLRHRLQVSAGDRVAHLAVNSPVFLALIFACARIGALLVPLNYRLARPEISLLLDDAGPKLLIGESALLTEFIAYEITPSGCRLMSLDRSEGIPGCEDLAAYLDCAEIEEAPQGASDPAAPLLIVYTSGTTGKPKGAVLDQNAIRWNALNSQHMHALTESDHVLNVLPFFHVGGINIQTLPAFHYGASVTVLPRFDPAEVLSTIVGADVTLVVLVPTQMQAIAALPQWSDADLSSLRAVTTGSTIVDAGLLQAWEQHGVRTLQVFGCTESSPIGIYQGIDDCASPIGSIGREAKHCKARIVDENDMRVEAMRHGEIQLKGPNIMRGYWNNPEATANALRDGWLATGDVGYRDEAGNYFVVDRKKNMIISGGENIYPAEIERVLLTHPDIDDAAVFGLPDDVWGEIVAAAIVTCADADLNENSALDFLSERVGRYKLPRRVSFEAALPRNAMGKTDYRALRTRFISQA